MSGDLAEPSTSSPGIAQSEEVLALERRLNYAGKGSKAADLEEAYHVGKVSYVVSLVLPLYPTPSYQYPISTHPTLV